MASKVAVAAGSASMPAADNSAAVVRPIGITAFNSRIAATPMAAMIWRVVDGLASSTASGRAAAQSRVISATSRVRIV